MPRSPSPSREERRELQLLDAWRQGDSNAIATLLRGYQARVYAVCARMLRSPEDAADLTQESLVKILEGLHTFDRRAQLSTWVIRVTMNCCLSHLRKQRLRRHASLDDFGQRSGSWASLGASLPANADSEPEAALGVERREQQAAVLRGLSRLDSEARAILVLRDTQGLEYQQIGEVLGVPVGTVKSRLFRARAALRHMTEQELGSEGGQPSELAPAPASTPTAVPEAVPNAVPNAVSNAGSPPGAPARGATIKPASDGLAPPPPPRERASRDAEFRPRPSGAS